MIVFESEWISLEIVLEPYFRITKFYDKKNQCNVLTADSGKIYADRSVFPESIFESYQKTGTNQWKLRYKSGTISITRYLECYGTAVRWYDILETTENIAGMYHSDLACILFSDQQKFRCWDYFSCSDQSNHRFLDNPAEHGKNKGGYLISEKFWIYKEGPMPDCQPIKGEYDFLLDYEQNRLNMVGLGFDHLRKGEIRRCNGVVIGLRSHWGLQRYRLERYHGFPEAADAEILSNSWPELTLGISEEAILKEIECAAESGINVVFIDDGWFSLFMGEIDEKKFPNGFTKLKEKAEILGIELGLWMNPLGMDVRHPEMLIWDGAECHDTMLENNPWNWMARSDDFISRDLNGDCTSERSYAGIELMDPECYQFRLNQIISYTKLYNIKHFKFDLYQLTAFDTLLGDANLHYEKYRQLLNDLQNAIPGMIISMDVTRRNRPNFDFGLDYGRLFLENRGRSCRDHRYYHPYMALGNFWYTLNFLPGIRMEIEMMPQAEDYPLDYILGTTIFGTPLYWGCVSKLSPERKKQMKSFYKRINPLRKIFARNLNVPVGEMPLKGSWSGILSIHPDETEFYLAVYRNGSGQDVYSFEFPFDSELTVLEGPANITPDGMIRLESQYSFSLIYGTRKS